MGLAEVEMEDILVEDVAAVEVMVAAVEVMVVGPAEAVAAMLRRRGFFEHYRLAPAPNVPCYYARVLGVPCSGGDRKATRMRLSIGGHLGAAVPYPAVARLRHAPTIQ